MKYLHPYFMSIYVYIYTICMSMTHYVRAAGLDSGLSLQESKVFI